MPKLGDVISVMPGHRAIFRGKYVKGFPVYETVAYELRPDNTQFLALLQAEQKKNT